MTKSQKKFQRKEECIARYTAGARYEELYESFPEINESTIRRWIGSYRKVFEDPFQADRDIAKERAAVGRVRTHQQIVSDIDILEVEAPPTDMLRAQTLRFADKKYGAGLDYQLASAVWLSNCRYKLAIETTNMQGVMKIITLPILPDNIDWESKVVHFNETQYPLSCLIPDNSLAKTGLEMLMKLTGTDTASSEDVKQQSKQVAIAAEKDANNENVSSTTIVMNRPRRKSIEEVLNGRDESRQDTSES
tara:strand:+ start:188 stop:934 length:747 start_codon:yes stop_codon:yes gene_type:complete